MILNFVVSLVALLLLVAIVCYIFIAYPLMIIVRCSSDKGLSPSAKSAWLACLFLLGPVTAGVYSILRPSAAGQRTRGIVVLALTAFCASGLALGYGYARSIGIQKTRSAAQVVSFNGVDEALKVKFVAATTALANEIEAGPWYHLKKQTALLELVTQLNAMVEDGAMDRLEVDEWLIAFEARNQGK